MEFWGLFLMFILGNLVMIWRLAGGLEWIDASDWRRLWFLGPWERGFSIQTVRWWTIVSLIVFNLCFLVAIL